MTDPREQLEMLVSRSADGDLTAEEQGIVRAVVEKDAAVAAEVRRFEKLDAKLMSWRRLPAQVDWASFHSNVSQSLKAEQHSEVDALVREAAGPMPAVDWNAFKSRVSTAVRAEAARGDVHDTAKYRMPGAVRWLVPIGLAAAVAIAFFRTGNGPLPVQPKMDDRPSIVLVSLEAPESVGKISIEFDESPAPAAEEDTTPGTAYVFTAQDGSVDFDEDEQTY
jgi:hypothetical protein